MSGFLSQLGSLSPMFAILVDTALKGLVLIAAAAIVAYALRNKSAAARHAAWTAAVIGHLALPVVSFLVPQWRIPLLPAPAWLTVESTGSSTSAIVSEPAVASASSETASTTGEALDPIAAPVASQSQATQPAERQWPASTMLGILWVLGSTLTLLRLAVGTWRVGRLAKFGERVDDGEWLALMQRVANRLGITRPLTLLRGDKVAIPVTWGVIYPAVLLPPEANDWPEARRRFVLVHEMAHVKRFDALTQLVAQITVAILWFDPFIWYAAHRMRVEREHACDDYVLRDGTVPSLYAGELLEMVQSIRSQHRESAAPAFAALAMARRSEFEGRMLAILDSRQERKSLGRKSAFAASAALAVLVVPLAALRPFEPVTAIPVMIQVPLAAVAADARKNTGYDPMGEKEGDIDAPARLSKGLPTGGIVRMPAGATSANVPSQYGSVDDPTMILMALQGAREISSDTDRLTLLVTVAPKALGKKNAALRRAYFEATAAMTSDTDLKGALIAALEHGNGEPEVTLAVFKAVGTQMTSDTDKRDTLEAAVERKLLKTSSLREAFMVAARTIESSTDFTSLMESALK